MLFVKNITKENIKYAKIIVIKANVPIRERLVET